jgi:hypothetical protein
VVLHHSHSDASLLPEACCLPGGSRTIPRRFRRANLYKLAPWSDRSRVWNSSLLTSLPFVSLCTVCVYHMLQPWFKCWYRIGLSSRPPHHSPNSYFVNIIDIARRTLLRAHHVRQPESALSKASGVNEYGSRPAFHALPTCWLPCGLSSYNNLGFCVAYLRDVLKLHMLFMGTCIIEPCLPIRKELHYCW